MKVYNLDIEKLSLLLTPTFLRKARMCAWLFTLLSPLKNLHYAFTIKRKTDIQTLGYNGQKCYLRKALNDAFDIQQRRIEIVEGNKFSRQYIYTRGEQKPRFLGTMYLRDRADYADTGVDFLVLIPKELEGKKVEINALVNYYKLASKIFKIYTK
ncbi:hypothetical protein [Ornithobacterium rhinotracheale]